MTDFVLFKKPVASPIFFRSDSTLQYLRYRILLRKRLKGKHLKVIRKILNYKEYKSHFTQCLDAIYCLESRKTFYPLV